MEIILLVLFLAGLPRSLWCIPAFILMWGLAGGSSGGSSGMGDNIGYWLIFPVVFGVALWGIYSNIRRAAEKPPDQHEAEGPAAARKRSSRRRVVGAPQARPPNQPSRYRRNSVPLAHSPPED